MVITEKEREELRRELLIAQVLHDSLTPEPRRKPRWQQFLESSGGTALITVVIGGIAGALISAIIQAGAKDREFQQSWLKARGDQAMVAYKDFVDKREELITRIFERIGSAISTSEDLIELSKTEYAVAERQGKQRAEVAKIRDSIKDSFSKNEKEWRNDKKRLEALLSYYYPAKPDVPGVLQVWQSLDNSLSTYMKCAEQWLKEHPREDNVSNACSMERESLAEQIHQLGRAFNTNRAYIWEGWESPEKLKESLAK